MTDILLAAYVITPALIIVVSVLAILRLRRGDARGLHLHPGE